MQPRKEPVDRLLKPIEACIFSEISRNRKLLVDNKLSKDDSSLTMLQYWMAEDPSLDDKELYNLCMTFLTMGHENVATVPILV